MIPRLRRRLLAEGRIGVIAVELGFLAALISVVIIRLLGVMTN